jgi:hypothetical protein
MQADAGEAARWNSGAADDNHFQDKSPIAKFPVAVNLNVIVSYTR